MKKTNEPPRRQGRQVECLLALSLLMAAASCKDKAAQPAPQKSASEAAEPLAGARDASADEDAGLSVQSFAMASAGDSERVKALVDAWLASQNQGDFAAYQALYGEGFTGIRRSGKRVVALDRNGWLEDRGRMFKKPMVVTIDKLTVVERKGQLSALFTQTWQSGSYKDVGRKWLRLTGHGGQLLIDREEMLDSTLLDPAERPEEPVAARPTTGEVELGFSDKGGLYLAPVLDGQAVLGRVSAPIGKGPVTVIDHTIDAASGTLMGIVAEQAIDPSKLPPELAGYPGASLQILDSDLTPSCTAKVTGLRLGLADWVLDDRSADEPIDAATAMIAESATLIADLSLPNGCEARFARDPGLPRLTGPGQLSDDNGKAISAALRDEAGEPDDESTEMDVDFVAVAGAPSRAIGQVSRHIPDSCETQESYTTTLYRLERKGDGWHIAGELASYDEQDALVTAADFDGDGSIEVVTERGVIAADGSRDAWDPDLSVFWPAGLGCDGYDGEEGD